MTTVLEGAHSPKSPYLTDMIWQGLPQAQSRRPKVFPRPPVKNLAYSRIQSPPLQTAPYTAIYSLLPPLSFFLRSPTYRHIFIVASAQLFSPPAVTHSQLFLSSLRFRFSQVGAFLAVSGNALWCFSFFDALSLFLFFLFLIWFFCFCGKQSSEVEIRKRSWICSFRERESLF